MATLSQQPSVVAFLKRHPVLTFYTLTFAISWGSLLLVVGPGAFVGIEPMPQSLFLLIAVLVPLAGPYLPGILLTGLVYGRAGLRDLRARLLRWRVGVRWYAVALLTAPLLTAATLLALSLISPAYLPAIVTSPNKVGLLVAGIALGLVVGFCEEIGWTGFATPELRKRHGILATGLIMGVLWGAWHFPLFAASAASSGAVPRALYVAVLLFSFLPPYRVLMVWVYDRTGSVLVAALMHAPLSANALILTPLALSGVRLVASDLLVAAALWVVVAAIVVANGGRLSRAEHARAIPVAHEASNAAVPS